ncbi:hypothetical protein EV657_13812 [Rhodovulum visakhapatnamense]|uniref:HTH IS21-type domain-containing protein n=1 Tax=Rhodovulum visakhapatnamense TaxID=364297 RepID=A0A4R8F862_9RHOB|nr:transposase [Rhodovulum visakhapatnamense]TDX21589.1 hypothetical protein EV657_13812 [Rhodovulum visakhapatnamense]
MLDVISLVWRCCRWSGGQGLDVSAIALQTGLDRKTVRKYLDHGLEAQVYGPREPEERLAEDYHNCLVDRLATWPGLHREIKASNGLRGAYSTLTEYLRLIRAASCQFERRFETPARQQAQVDFAEVQVEFTSEPGVIRKVWLFSMVLGHSRWLWGRFCPNQTLETVMRCHSRPSMRYLSTSFESALAALLDSDQAGARRAGRNSPPERVCQQPAKRQHLADFRSFPMRENLFGGKGFSEILF